MFGFFLDLLKAKLLLLGSANIPVLAALIVIGTSGFLVTGTTPAEGDEDGDHRLAFVVVPLESKTCVDALIAQTETLLELDALASDATVQLRHLRERAREQADDQHKAIDQTALRAQFDSSTGKIRGALSTARQQVFAAADLASCQDQDPNTGVAVNLEILRATYDGILSQFGLTLNGILAEAQSAFDQLVATAPPKPKKHEKDDDEDDDDD